MSSVVTMLERISMPLMMTAAVSRSLRVLATRPSGAPPVRGLWARSVSPPSISGMTETPVSKPLSPRASFGNTSTAPAISRGKLPCASSAERQPASRAGFAITSRAPRPRTTRVEGEVGQRGGRRQADRLIEPLQEDRREHGEDRERDEDRVVPENGLEEWILDGVLGGVGGRQRHRDHKVGGSKAEQNQDEPLALPAAEQILEHGDGPLPGVAAPGHLRVDWQSAEQRHEDEDDGSDRGHRAGREQRDAGLVAEGREVVDARQPDDLPPGMGRGRLLGVDAHGFTAPQPLSDDGSILERGLRQLFAK
jgi:hypothetical protein